jgi:hypothetical protein
MTTVAGSRKEKALEAGMVTALVGAFLASVLVFPRSPDLRPFMICLGFDQWMAGPFLESLRENSFWDLLTTGRLPSQGQPSHHGTLFTYLFAPFLAVFGQKWWLFKFWHLLFAVPTLLFAYGTVRLLAGRLAALLSLSVLVIHPFYVSGMRAGGDMVSPMQFFSMGAIFFLLEGWSRRRAISYGLSALFLGCGMSTYLWFYWFLVAVLVWAALNAGEIRGRWTALPPAKRAAWSGTVTGCFLLGLAPVMYREFFYPLEAFRSVGSQAFDPANAFSFPNYGTAFVGALRFLRDVFSGILTAGGHAMDGYFLTRGNPFFPPFIAASVGFLLARFAVTGNRGLLALPVLLAVMVLLLPVTTSLMLFNYAYFLYPLPPLVVGLAFAEGIRSAAGRRPWIAAAVVLLGLFVLTESAALVRLFGGLRGPAVSGDRRMDRELIGWLRENGPAGKTVVCRGRSGVGAEDSRWRFAWQFPDSRVRFVFPPEAEVATVPPVDVAHAVYEFPESEEISVVWEGTTEEQTNALARTRLSGAGADRPLAAFESADGDTSCRVFSGVWPERAPVLLAVIPPFRKAE